MASRRRTSPLSPTFVRVMASGHVSGHVKTFGVGGIHTVARPAVTNSDLLRGTVWKIVPDVMEAG